MSRSEGEKVAVKNMLATPDTEIEAAFREKLAEFIESLEERVPELVERLTDAQTRLRELRELQFRTLGMTK